MSTVGRIPRIIHQTWLGPDPLPEDDARWVETWRAHHPEWEHHLWTDANLPEGLVRNEGYELIRHPVERSDILRLELVYRFGGVYVDTDVECLRPIDPLLEGVTMFVQRLNSGRLSHFVMGATPQHPVLERALAGMKPREYFGYDKFSTGPDFLASFIDEDAGVTILDTDVYMPRDPAAQRVAYGIHHSAGAWKSAEDWQKDARIAQRRYQRTQIALDELEQRHRETVAELEVARARLAGKHVGALAAEVRVVAIRTPHRLLAAAKALKRKLRATGAR